MINELNEKRVLDRALSQMGHSPTESTSESRQDHAIGCPVEPFMVSESDEQISPCSTRIDQDS